MHEPGCGLDNPSVRGDTHTRFSSLLTPPPFVESLYHLRRTQLKMLDLSDFITERGGDPKRIKESQRKRNAPEESVDEVIALFEQARNGMYDLP